MSRRARLIYEDPAVVEHWVPPGALVATRPCASSSVPPLPSSAPPSALSSVRSSASASALRVRIVAEVIRVHDVDALHRAGGVGPYRAAWWKATLA